MRRVQDTRQPVPLAASRRRVAMPSTGDLRATLVAPMFPLPLARTSSPVNEPHQQVSEGDRAQQIANYCGNHKWNGVHRIALIAKSAAFGRSHRKALQLRVLRSRGRKLTLVKNKLVGGHFTEIRLTHRREALLKHRECRIWPVTFSPFWITGSAARAGDG